MIVKLKRVSIIPFLIMPEIIYSNGIDHFCDKYFMIFLASLSVIALLKTITSEIKSWKRVGSELAHFLQAKIPILNSQIPINVFGKVPLIAFKELL